MSTLDPTRLKQVFDSCERLIERRWGIPVRVNDVPSPFTGDLDGAKIDVDYDLEIEDALFILLHLFGHTVQWNASPAAREIAFYKPPEGQPWPDDKLAAVAQYEGQACQYSLQLLHDAGVHDLDQWVADFAACDVAYLMHFYKTGEKRPFSAFAREAEALALLQHGKVAEAKDMLAILKNDLDTPQTVSRRAQLAIDAIDSGGAANVQAIIRQMAAAQAAAAAAGPAAAQAPAAAQPEPQQPAAPARP